MRLLFEGPSIESLLARVRDEHGPGARIVAADKVRRGGFAGFFTREGYAITVEVDPSAEVTLDAAPTPVVQRPVDAPGTLLELADAIDAAEAAEAHVVMSTASVPHAALALDAGQSSTCPAPGGRVATVVPALSTESLGFAAVLAGWAGDASPIPAVQAVPAVPAAAPFVPARLERVTAAPQRVESELSRRLLALGLPPVIVESIDAAGDGEVLERLAGALAEALPVPPTLALRPGDVLVIAGAGAAAFELAGVLAKRLRLEPNHVLLAAASTLGTGINPSRRLSGPSEARRRSARMHRADVATIVALDAPCDGGSAPWARDVTDALGARTMWALVDATTKPADLVDHLGGFGRLDGIAVCATGATRDPASVLGAALDLDLPTVWLDGRPGDARAWATLLAERVAQ